MYNIGLPMPRRLAVYWHVEDKTRVLVPVGLGLSKADGRDTDENHTDKDVWEDNGRKKVPG